MYIAERYKIPVFIFIFFFTGLNIFGLKELSFDFEIEQLFPKNDPDLDFYQNHVEPFQSEGNYVLVAIESEYGIFNQKFLQKLDSLHISLEKLDFVEEVLSLKNLNYFKLSPFLVPQELSFLHPKQPEKLVQDSVFLRSYTDAWEKYMSNDGKATAMFLELSQDSLYLEAKDRLVVLQNVLKKYSPGIYHLSGSLDAREGVISQLKREFILLSFLSLLFILGVLAFTFRSLSGVLIPLFVILLSVNWTVGSMALLGIQVNTMTVLVPSITLIVALSDVIHIMSRFKEEFHHTASPKMAINLAMKDIGKAILLTSLTTAVGFLSLTYANIQPFVEFGLFTALGVVYAYLLSVILLPKLLMIRADYRSPVQSRFTKWASKLFSYSLKHQKSILLLSLSILLLCCYGISKLKVDSQMYEEISSGDEYSQSLYFLDTQFHGIRPVEIYLALKDPEKTLYDYDMMQKLDSLEQFLTDTFQANSIYTVLTQVKRLNRVYKQGRPQHFELPEDTTVYQLIRQVLDTSYQRMELQNILSHDYRSTLVQAKIEDLGSYEISLKNQQLREYGLGLFPPDDFIFRITGKAQLLDKSNELITRNLGLGLLAALGIVAMIMGILFRSFRIVICAFIPNILPLLVIAGVMGYLDIGLKMSTAIIYSIAFGIAVDDTIHFLSRLKIEWRAGVPLEDALKKTCLSTGKAIIITTLILVLGFGILLFSAFQATFTTGLFISLALAFAVFADLVLLPVLLIRIFSGEKKTTMLSA